MLLVSNNNNNNNKIIIIVIIIVVIIVIVILIKRRKVGRLLVALADGNGNKELQSWLMTKLPLWLSWKNNILNWSRFCYPIKYLENCKRYDVRLNEGGIGNHPLAFKWHHAWPWTLDDPNPFSSRSQDFCTKYLENGEKYGFRLHEGRMGNLPLLWPWMILNRPRWYHIVSLTFS